jgi:hypothetical protein
MDKGMIRKFWDRLVKRNKKMKILYLSCHAVLEHSEVKLLSELGYEVFSPGAYWDPPTGGCGMRPPLPDLKYDPEIVKKWAFHETIHPELDGKGYLTPEVVEPFDCIIVMHIPDWIDGPNWEVIKNKRVIWRTIGQSLASIEQRMKPYFDKGIEIVRYSPTEANIPHFAGQSGLIRFYKDPNEYCGWTGQNKRVITFGQEMQQRGSACNYPIFERVTRSFPRALFGPGNNQSEFGMGKVSFDQLKKEMRDNRVYFYTGTHPASYTLNFIESWMSGIPLVCVGPEHGNANHLRNHDLYEIPSLIQNGVNGFISDDENELVSYIRELMNSDELAEKISVEGRKTAIQHFGKDMIKASWDAYLSD